MTGGNKRLWWVCLSMYDLLLQPGIKSLGLKKKTKKQKNKKKNSILNFYGFFIIARTTVNLVLPTKTNAVQSQERQRRV